MCSMLHPFGACINNRNFEGNGSKHFETITCGFWSRGSRGWLTKTFTTSWRLLYPWCCGRCVGGSPQFARRQRCEGWFRSLERLGRDSGSKNYGTRTHIPYRGKNLKGDFIDSGLPAMCCCPVSWFMDIMSPMFDLCRSEIWVHFQYSELL